MRSFFNKALRLVPVAVFVFVGSAVFAQTPQQIHEVSQFKAKMDANADNPNFDMTAAQAELDRMMAAYGITELPEPGTGPVSSTVQAVNISPSPSVQAQIEALQNEIALYENDASMAGYVAGLRTELEQLLSEE